MCEETTRSQNQNHENNETTNDQNNSSEELPDLRFDNQVIGEALNPDKIRNKTGDNNE